MGCLPVEQEEEVLDVLVLPIVQPLGSVVVGVELGPDDDDGDVDAVVAQVVWERQLALELVVDPVKPCW